MRGAAYDPLKRVIDLFGAATALVLSAPLQVVIAILVKCKVGSPILFCQRRPGKDGEIFELYKFRSMLDVDVDQGLVTDEERLTPFGKALRSTSLDELPSLVNVLKGDMSLVGPRPLLVAYLGRYSPEQWRRHEVRPGLTGLAQVRGRNALDWEDKFRLDVEYVDRRSLRLDLRIIALTFWTVVRRQGIASVDAVTMPEFVGGARDEGR